ERRQLAQPRQDGDLLAHHEHALRPLGRQAADVVRALDENAEAAGLEMLAGQTQDLRVVGFTAGRVGLLAKDAPAERVSHLSPPLPITARAAPGSTPLPRLRPRPGRRLQLYRRSRRRPVDRPPATRGSPAAAAAGPAAAPPVPPPRADRRRR